MSRKDGAELDIKLQRSKKKNASVIVAVYCRCTCENTVQYLSVLD